MEVDERVSFSGSKKKKKAYTTWLFLNRILWLETKIMLEKEFNYHQPSQSKTQNNHCGIPDPSAICLSIHSSQGPRI